MKIKPKRTRMTEKLWYIFSPFIVYTVVKTAGMIFFSLLAASAPQGIAEVMQDRTDLVTAVINAIASLLAVYFVLKYFVIELNISGEVDIDKGYVRQSLKILKEDIVNGQKKWLSMLLTGMLGITTAVSFNIVVTLLHIGSQDYERVHQIQYSVPIWLGIILYGIVSPLVEEIVFRGITYNRIKRFFKRPICIIISALLFGIYHWNIEQAIYGTCMGIIMVLVYDWTTYFMAPLVFHMAANIFTFVVSMLFPNMNIASVGSLLIFIGLSLILFVLTYRISKKDE